MASISDNTHNLSDQSARLKALDCAGSFVVEAPAGSGKTELLTQRVLALLGEAVETPEAILAITFTRKAASEMRERIFSRLNAVACGETLTHARTQQLAEKVLSRSIERDWHLLTQTHRLRIVTIDAFNHMLLTHAPIDVFVSPSWTVLEDPEPLYRKAVEHVLATLHDPNDPIQTSLTTVLAHIDNRCEQLSDLLCAMLSARDQWLPFVLDQFTPDILREKLTLGFARSVEHYLDRIIQKIPPYVGALFWECIRHAVTNRLALQPELQPLSNITQWPMPISDALPIWRILVDLLMTQTGQFRKKADKRMGFSKDTPESNAYQRHMQQVLDQLSVEQDFCERLARVRTLPDPHYSHAQWEVLLALWHLLPRVVAELHLLFEKQKSVDYVAKASAALDALGNADYASDLTLALNAQLSHILIDEFQDTSITQLRLIEKLIADWTPGDRRTLFVVGDPLQSIYRFRQADVGLFLQTKYCGIQGYPLEVLTLHANFRAAPALVDWYNQTFSKIFPKEDDLSEGAVAYVQAVAEITEIADASVQWHKLPAEALPTEEAAAIIACVVQTHEKYPKHRIGILLRTRAHASTLVLALQKANIRYESAGMDRLENMPGVIDWAMLVRAITDLHDRVAWTALLRGPFCGLTLIELTDLLSESKHHIIWDVLLQAAPSHPKITLLVTILHKALAQIGHLPLHMIVETAWVTLGGPNTTQDTWQPLAQCFEALSTLQWLPGQTLETTVQQFISQPYKVPIREAPVTLMTIHKAKGLEFDTVIIPGCDRIVQTDGRQLLLWQEIAHEDGTVDALLTPIPANEVDGDPLYAFLNMERMLRARHEQKRLLYVACTRAKHSLHLFTRFPDSGKPAANSFSGMLSI